MGPSWIFFFNHACFLLVHYVHALKRGSFPSDDMPPTLVPDCSALEPPLCTNTYSTDPTTGKHTFDYYLETCPSHQCTQITPTDYPTFPLPVLTAPPGFQPIVVENCENTTFEENFGPIYTMDTTNKFTRQSNYWFCQSTQIGYTARVEKNTGLAPGLKEDYWAQCQWERFHSLVNLGTDPCYERYGGHSCTTSYRYYICAMAFPKCQPATGGLTPTGTADIYGAETLPLLQQQSIMYTITKPCRTLCYNLIRTCDQQTQLSCHLKESRDWADYPGCNVAGNPAGGELYLYAVARKATA
ncbi:unnamed protein product [Calypogeia fissa]